ncbi:hypothetical protein HYW42_04390 [Candidatus Daviesbacteria bacterium]|nr:hypothetical protein [Candidatus Daviesbacteria bacterium]
MSDIERGAGKKPYPLTTKELIFSGILPDLLDSAKKWIPRQLPSLSTVAAGLGYFASSGIVHADQTITAPYCQPGQKPEFVLGFKSITDAVIEDTGDPGSVGAPLECEHTNPDNGDALQKTSTGLTFYRKSTNTPTFTNGYDHWALVANEGLVKWTGESIDPPGLGALPGGPGAVVSEPPICKPFNIFDRSPSLKRRIFSPEQITVMDNIALKGTDEDRNYMKHLLGFVKKDPASYALVTKNIVSLEMVDVVDPTGRNTTPDNIVVNSKLTEGTTSLSHRSMNAVSYNEADVFDNATALVIRAKSADIAQRGNPFVGCGIVLDGTEQSKKRTVMALEAGRESMTTGINYLIAAKAPANVIDMYNKQLKLTEEQIKKYQS